MLKFTWLFYTEDRAEIYNCFQSYTLRLSTNGDT